MSKQGQKVILWSIKLSARTPVNSLPTQRCMCRPQQHPGSHGTDIEFHRPEGSIKYPGTRSGQLKEESIRAYKSLGEIQHSVVLKIAQWSSELAISLNEHRISTFCRVTRSYQEQMSRINLKLL